MQAIPTGNLGPAVDLSMLFIVTIILVLIVTILGYRRHARHLQYWVIAIIEIIGFVLLWWFLSEMVSSMILIYTGYPLEITLIIIYVAIALIFLGFCFLLIIIDKCLGISIAESEIGTTAVEG
ncbi:MAG: hypothetical protein ACFFEV_01060 [Candidatus Thorarchaeota archaeon]